MVVSYTAGGIFFLTKIFQLRGSVFPKAFFIALPCAIISAILRVLIDNDVLAVFQHEHSIMKETQAFSGFSFLVGFLIVFRTSQGYNRFWDGCGSTHHMRAEWFDAAAALVAFCKHSSSDPVIVRKFQNTLIRLFSMLHAAALAELEQLNVDDESEEIQSFDFDLIDPSSIDEESLRSLKYSTSKVELIFSWIQFLIVENMPNGVLSIPPPILSRAFQEIANGMVAFHNAMKITYVPFPFPYAQTCDLLLLVHWVVVPLVTTQWVTEPLWAGVFVMIQVFILWSLNLIAVEIENPFGQDANDLNGRHMQVEMNRHLLLLLQPETLKTPQLVGVGLEVCSKGWEDLEVKSFNDVFMEITGASLEVQKSARTAVFTHADVQVMEKTVGRVSGKRSINVHRLSYGDMKGSMKFNREFSTCNLSSQGEIDRRRESQSSMPERGFAAESRQSSAFFDEEQEVFRPHRQHGQEPGSGKPDVIDLAAIHEGEHDQAPPPEVEAQDAGGSGPHGSPGASQKTADGAPEADSTVAAPNSDLFASSEVQILEVRAI